MTVLALPDLCSFSPLISHSLKMWTLLLLYHKEMLYLKVININHILYFYFYNVSFVIDLLIYFFFFLQLENMRMHLKVLHQPLK